MAEEQNGKKSGPSGATSMDQVREELIIRAKAAQARESATYPEKPKPLDTTDFAPVIPAGLGTGGGADIQTGGQPAEPPTASQILRKALQMKIVLSGPSMQDMAIFCRQLSTLLDVGIPLLRSLKILAERTHHPRLRKITAKIARRVEEGNTLSSALREHPKTFSHLFVSVIEVGEIGGILESSVRRLAELLEMKTRMRKRVRSALMYPVLALIVCIAVLFFVMYWAVPKFQHIYEGLKADLPKATKRLIAMSNFIKNYPQIYVPAVVVTMVGLFLYGRTRPGKYTYAWLAMRTKIIGPICTKINVARFTRSVGSLVAAGIPLLEALKVTARTSENILIEQKLNQVHDVLEAGGRLEDPLRADAIIPPMVTDMIVIGYESGAIDDMMLRIADTYDADVDETIKGLSSIIEPLLIVVLGFAVAFIAIALLLPYFSLAHNV
ncbi:MAG: type II secretion system F family protein [Candidatus Sumerlaeota bacterium]|nr:type II secretion system F family protein [Candidatus Sumerlaeota bacterium]